MGENGHMKPHTLMFVAGLLLMVLTLFAYLGQYCPSCAVEGNWSTWGLWIAMFTIGAVLAALGLLWGAKKP